jgi:hypothetical protein
LAIHDDDDDDDSRVACVAHLVSNTTPEDSTSSQVEWRLQLWLIDTTTMSNDTPTSDNDDVKEQQTTNSHYYQQQHSINKAWWICLCHQSWNGQARSFWRRRRKLVCTRELCHAGSPLVQQSLVTAANSKQFTLELDYVSHCGLVWGLSKATYYHFGQGVGENDLGGLVFFDRFLNYKAHSFCHFQIDSSF